ncbi:MAG TPA: hypothetical protein PKM63_22280 [Panacibacter sp.]|nr:hypothetical protein [Panacibacter sp.]HNP47041.1 hypothetical protein [Panacibacter sp.]
MTNLSPAQHQIQYVGNFHDLVSTPFQGAINAICWHRQQAGDFGEIVNKLPLGDNNNMAVIEEEELVELSLSAQGQLAREVLLQDMELLKAHGASPVLNIIRCYERDDAFAFFPTDVYSFHVDRSPIPTDTFLCTYYGEPSDILPNEHALQKVLVPEIREELKKRYTGTPEGFESFLSEHFFDLHYMAKPGAQTISLGTGHLWRLAIDHPGLEVPPCVHRAPKEKTGEPRLLLIC